MQAKTEGDEGNDPRGAIEAGSSGSGEDGRPVFLNESLFDQAVAVAAGDSSHQFVAHHVGVGAADMVTFEEDLIAAADAHQLMAELFESRRGITGAGEGTDGDAEQGALQRAAD